MDTDIASSPAMMWKEESPYVVFNITREAFISLEARVASCGRFRLHTRLAGYTPEGLIIASRWTHTLGRRDPVDLIYLDAQSTIIGLFEHVPPFRFAPFRPACRLVLQLPGHSIYRSHAQIGDRLIIGTPEQMQAYWATHMDRDADRQRQPGERNDAQPERNTAAKLTAYYWDGGPPRARELRDVSVSGAFIRTEQTFCRGTILDVVLEMPVPGRQDVPVPVRCMVMRSEAAGMAVHFYHAGRKERMQFQNLLAAVQPQPEPRHSGLSKVAS